ncbi:MAG: uracil-DNA glycosylase [Nanoarchaeota archaeon]
MSNTDKLKILEEKTRNADLPLKESAKNLVFGKGNPDAKIMLIGEASGANEDLQGIPFVGAAGKELDKLLRTIGLTIDDVYIANILKYRPPDNRNPSIEEIKTHTPYLIDQIKIIKPKIVVTLGNFSTKFIIANFKVDDMKKVSGITQLHGVPISKNIEGMEFKVFPMYHPAAVIYRRQLYTDLENDFLKLKELIQ